MRNWKIAPGRGGSLWVEQRDSRCIAVGWSAVGDLAQYRTVEELERAFKKQTYGSKPHQLWRFYK